MDKCLEKVKVNLPPLFNTLLSNNDGETIVWATLSLCSHVTAVPSATINSFGSKTKWFIVTVSPFTSAVLLTSVVLLEQPESTTRIKIKNKTIKILEPGIITETPIDIQVIEQTKIVDEIEVQEELTNSEEPVELRDK